MGAKSAWSYTDSFTVITFVDGTKRSYVAHIGVNNQGRLDLVSTDKTDEENGTEIQVAVKPEDIEEFRTAIFRATYFWNDKPRFKGELNPPTLVKGEVISDLLEVVDRDLLPEYIRPYNNEILAVMDGILYTLPQKLREKINHIAELDKLVRKTVVLHFGNGLIEVATSRETIADSAFTYAGIEQMGETALKQAKKHIADAFAAVSATPDYLRTYAALSKLFHVDSFAKYGDYTISRGSIVNPNFDKIKMTMVHCMGRYGRARVDKITKDELTRTGKCIEIDKLQDMFFVTTDESNIVQNKRIREYFKKNTHMMLLEVLHTNVAKVDAKGQPVLDKEGKPVWTPVSYVKEFKKVIAELGAKDFSGITYVDPPRVIKPKVKRRDTEICIHVVDRGRHKYTTLATNTQKWIYVPLSKGSWPTKYNRQMLNELSDYTFTSEETKVCGLADKFCAMVQGDSNFISIDDWMDGLKVNKDLILAAKKQFAKQGGPVHILSTLTDIEDKFILKMLGEYKEIAKGKVHHVPSLIAHKIAESKEVKEFKESDINFGMLMKDEYPLVQECEYTRNKKELAFYINAKYKSNKKGK